MNGAREKVSKAVSRKELGLAGLRAELLRFWEGAGCRMGGSAGGKPGQGARTHLGQHGAQGRLATRTLMPLQLCFRTKMLEGCKGENRVGESVGGHCQAAGALYRP